MPLGGRRDRIRPHTAEAGRSRPLGRGPVASPPPRARAQAPRGSEKAEDASTALFRVWEKHPLRDPRLRPANLRPVHQLLRVFKMKTWDLVLGASLAGAPRGAGLSFRLCVAQVVFTACVRRVPRADREPGAGRPRTCRAVRADGGRTGPLLPPRSCPGLLSGAPRFVWSHRGWQTDTGRWDGGAWLPAASARPSPPGGPVPAPTDGFYSVGKAKTRKERGGWEPTRPHRPCQPALSKVTVRQTGRCHTGFR